jgi:hypothetical protein
MGRSPLYSDSFDMEGNTRLLVEARLLPDASLPSSHAILWVQGTDDGKSEKRNWVYARPAIDLDSGTMERREFHDLRGTVRVVVDPLAPMDPDCIQVRLTRLP